MAIATKNGVSAGMWKARLYPSLSAMPQGMYFILSGVSQQSPMQFRPLMAESGEQQGILGFLTREYAVEYAEGWAAGMNVPDDLCVSFVKHEGNFYFKRVRKATQLATADHLESCAIFHF